MRLLIIAFLATLSVISGCSNSSSSTPSQDSQNLQGSWKLTGATYDGGSISDDVRWTFDGDELIAQVHGASEKSQFKLGTAGPNTIWIGKLEALTH